MRVAICFAKDYPEAVKRLVVMDNISTLIISECMNATIVAEALLCFLSLWRAR